MLITTKGRYALRFMVYISSFPDRKITLREVAENEAISAKYLEQLAHEIVKANLLTSVRGHGGGYTLTRKPSEITVGDVLRAVEKNTAPVSCPALEEEGGCPREQTCTTISFWAGFDQIVEHYIDSKTLADLAAPELVLSRQQTDKQA